MWDPASFAAGVGVEAAEFSLVNTFMSGLCKIGRYYLILLLFCCCCHASLGFRSNITCHFFQLISSKWRSDKYATGMTFLYLKVTAKKKEVILGYITNYIVMSEDNSHAFTQFKLKFSPREAMKYYFFCTSTGSNQCWFRANKVFLSVLFQFKIVGLGSFFFSFEMILYV